MWSWLRLRKRAASVRRTFRRFVPVLEQLEPRLALAGNVAAVVSAGSLIVTGDNLGADITISQPAAGKITIAGNGTTVNGSAGPVTFSRVTRNLSVNFGKGDDSLAFDQTNPITLSGNLSINGGQGSNTVYTLLSSTSPLNVGGNLSILNLPGPSEVTYLLNLNVKGSVQIQNLGGNAYVGVGYAYASVSNILGNLLIANGPGNSDVTDLSSNVNGNVQISNRGTSASTTIYSSDGQNTIGGSLEIINGPGQVSQTASYSTQIDSTNVGQNLQLAGVGAVESYIGLTNSAVGGSTILSGGNGDTTVLVDNAMFGGAFLLQTGNGADNVSIGTAGAATITRLVPEARTKTVTDPTTGRVYEETYIVFVPVYETIEEAGTPVTFNGLVAVGLGGGDDTLNLALDAEVSFHKVAIMDDEGGHNTAYVHTANVSGVPMLIGFQVVDE